MYTDKLRLIGKISRAHGIEGKAFLVFESSFYKNLKKSEWVFLNINGLPVPFFLLSIEFSTDTSAIIQLEDIDNINKLLPFIGMEVLIEWKGKLPSIENHSFIGYEIHDSKDNNLGIITAFEDYNGNTVATVKNSKGEILLPINEANIIKADHRKKILIVDVPEGLLSLYLK
jgi:16S rRNA processing protein RimM